MGAKKSPAKWLSSFLTTAGLAARFLGDDVVDHAVGFGFFCARGITAGAIMDQGRRTRLIELARAQGIETNGVPDPVVSLEDFFTGNDDPGSIGCNTKHPGPAYFAAPLYAIRARPDVQDVLVEIYEVEEGDDSMWPFSERIYVLTSADMHDVADWLSPLRPTTVEEGYAYVEFGDPPAAPSLQPGMKVYAAWWD